MLGKAIVGSFVVAAVLSCALVAQAVNIDLVPVGNSGNAANTDGHGSVGYEYQIGKYEVTAGQYTEFLNAVAATDTYGLYDTAMTTLEMGFPYGYGCQIQRSGSEGSYTYSIAANLSNRPVNYISWGDAARFANWMHNGQPAGAQNLGTTEDGAYYLNGATAGADLLAVTRESDAKWFIPTEDEWYKAAYHDQSAGLAANYFDYATGSDSTPSNAVTNPDGGNNANFCDMTTGYTLGGAPYTTEVGEFEYSESPYGTFDQSGNLQEWNEAVYGAGHQVRGGHFGNLSDSMLASYSGSISPDGADYCIGFRLGSAVVPEPGSIAMLIGTALMGLLCYAWKKRK